MQIVDIFAYFALLVSTTVAPGPLMAILVARTIGGDIRGAAGFGAGVAIGDVMMMALVCLGLGIWLQGMPQIFSGAKIVAVAYVFWIAWKIWNGEKQSHLNTEEGSSAPSGSVIAGIVTCLVSPQTILLYMMILPRLVDINAVTLPQFLLIAAVTVLALTATFATVILLAARLSQLFGSGEGVGIVNKVSAGMICLSGVWLVAG